MLFLRRHLEEAYWTPLLRTQRKVAAAVATIPQLRALRAVATPTEEVTPHGDNQNVINTIVSTSTGTGTATAPTLRAVAVILLPRSEK